MCTAEERVTLRRLSGQSLQIQVAQGRSAGRGASGVAMAVGFGQVWQTICSKNPAMAWGHELNGLTN